MQTPTRHHRRYAAIRLLLVLVLGVAPLMSYAMMPFGPPAETGFDEQHMPCHETETATPVQGNCAHCTGERDAGPCPCCGWVAPGALPGATVAAPDPVSGLVCTLGPTRPSWPESPPNAPYRPPIDLS